MKSPPLQHTSAVLWQGRGFSVLELVVVITLMGLLTTVVLMLMGTQPGAVKNTKLESDVATLNQMVAAYVTDGGNLTGLTDVKTVLERMKKGRPQTELQRHTGSASGRLVDTRLAARITTVASPQGLKRAKWNTQTQRFEMTTGTGSAVSEFYLDETLANKDFGSDSTRTAPNVKYNTDARGWVWGNAATSNFTYPTPGGSAGTGANKPFNPAEVGSAPVVDPGSGGGGSGGDTGGGGTGGGGNGPPAATALPKPAISPSGGTFAYTAFPTSATLSPNGAPSSGSVLQYQKNGGGWITYTGSPITLAPADKLEARNLATDTVLYKNSATSSATFYRLTSGFTATETGTWGNATGGANLVTKTDNGVTSSTFKHGNTKLDLGNGEFLDAGVENVLTFTKADFSNIAPNTWFNMGTLVMLNGTTFYNSEADGVTLSLNLSFSQPAQNSVVHINLGLISTENSSDRLASADIVELRNPTTDLLITIDGVQYRLELSWASQDPASGVVQGNQFLVFEGASATAQLRGRLVSNK